MSRLDVMANGIQQFVACPNLIKGVGRLEYIKIHLKQHETETHLWGRYAVNPFHVTQERKQGCFQMKVIGENGVIS